MGRGRYLGHAMSSKLVAPKGFRWAPKPNSHAICVGMELAGKRGGDRNAVKARFITASKVTCKGK